MDMREMVRLGGFAAFALLIWAQGRSDREWSPRVLLNVIDAGTGKPAAARFSLAVDGEQHAPLWVGPHGLRFVSVHVSKRQSAVVTYARGTGVVEAPLRPGAKTVEVRVAKGLDYEPVRVSLPVTRDPVQVEVKLTRWHRLREDGWRAADPHLHYDRVEAAADRDWFHAMDGDGLTHAQFMVLKGGMVPGLWAQQFAYGKRGEGSDAQRLIVPGEEYRDQMQGHLLLFGLSELIQPIQAGTADSPHHWPPFVDVLARARKLGGMVGAAHGGTLSASPTVLADAVLGALDFMEIGNLFIWAPETNWYPLLNCGYILPPTAGSDLPNAPYRDWWQPFLGSIRTYVKTGDQLGTEAWNAAVKRGETFVSSGPMIRLAVNGVGPGGRIDLPPGGGEVEIEAELTSPRELRKLELVRNGEVIASAGPGERKLGIRTRVRADESCWIAARGVGARIPAMEEDEVAHTGVVQVRVGGKRIWSARDASALIARLTAQKEVYRVKAKYAREEDRHRMLGIFDEAVRALRRD
jgi:hypothetical protein